MSEKEIIDMINSAEAGKILVADILAKTGNEDERDDAIRCIDALSHKNVIRVLKDKDLKRFVARMTGKVAYDLSTKPCASKDQMDAFRNAAFTFEDAYVTNIANHRRYNFKVVKLAGKSFADVFTPEGKQAGFIRYITSTIHPWFVDVGENHYVLQFTTIGEGKNIIDRETGISYWVNKDFYKEAFGELRKEGFQMKAMQGLVKMVINKMQPVQHDAEGKRIRRPSVRIRINSIGLALYNSKEIDEDIQMGDTTVHIHKDIPDADNLYPELKMTVGDEDVASAWFREFRNSDNFFESNVRVFDAGNLIPSEIITAMTDIMEKYSKVSLGNGFEHL